MSIKKHPKKEIQEAIEYAVANGWRIIETGKSSHAFCRLYCPAKNREGCSMSVNSTPRNTQTHAKQILRKVDNCPH